MHETALPCGRFAPTPSGPLHLGSLVAAVGSFLAARSAGGRWRVRVDDLDAARALPGAASQILSALEAHGLHWDGAVLYQSERREAHRAALEALRHRDAVFPCTCTRQKVIEAGRRGPEGPLYPGTCRAGLPAGRRARVWRARTDGAAVTFDDRVVGRVEQRLEHTVGDYVVWRAEGFAAYHLACVVDDAFMGVTEVVRGRDLLLSTGCQLHLYRQLGVEEPGYAHLPLVLGRGRAKLAKGSGATALEPRRAGDNLRFALEVLGIACPDDDLPCIDLLAHAVASFDWSCIRERGDAELPARREPKSLSR